MFLSHVEIQCADFAKSAQFYDAVMATLGAGRREDKSPYAIGYGVHGPDFWIGTFVSGTGFRESHIAFAAETNEQVDAFVEAARALGYEVLHEPREWPEYTGDAVAGYYAGFVRDPDGNNIEAAVCVLDLPWLDKPTAWAGGRDRA